MLCGEPTPPFDSPWGYILMTATDNLGLSSSAWLAVLFNDQLGVYGLCIDNYIAGATVFFGFAIYFSLVLKFN
jgi:hypothetical protein